MKVILYNTERRIFLAAIHVKTGCVKIFGNKDFCADILLTSAFLLFLFQAVRVDREYYCDGDYIANPTIYPLIDEYDCNDIIIDEEKVKPDALKRMNMHAIKNEDTFKYIT